MRRASSYHSYSQSPPYDFQYEERRYGKPGLSLTRKPGSDRGFYEGKLSSFSAFSSPSHFSDRANDALSPSPQRETWSPFSETMSDLSSDIHGHHTVLHNSEGNGGNNAGRIGRPEVFISYPLHNRRSIDLCGLRILSILSFNLLE